MDKNVFIRRAMVLLLGAGLSAPWEAAAQAHDAIPIDGKIPCTPSDTTHSCCLKQHPTEPEACGGSINQMQKEIDRQQAPKEVERADRAHAPEDPQDHVHLKDGTRLRRDGTTKPENKTISRAVREWLRKWGWPF